MKENTKEVPLEPCPFCGGEPMPAETDQHTYCGDCGVMTLTHFWNRRAPSLAVKQTNGLDALHILYNVDSLLGDAGFAPDSSARHQLSIAMSVVREMGIAAALHPQEQEQQQPAQTNGGMVEVEVIDPYVMDLVRQHGHYMTNSEIVQKFLPKRAIAHPQEQEQQQTAMVESPVITIARDNWLIENRETPRKGQYLLSHSYGAVDWTDDAAKAMKFPDKDTANSFIKHTILHVYNLEVCEHVFNCGTMPEPAAHPQEQEQQQTGEPQYFDNDGYLLQTDKLSDAKFVLKADYDRLLSSLIAAQQQRDEVLEKVIRICESYMGPIETFNPEYRTFLTMIQDIRSLKSDMEHSTSPHRASTRVQEWIACSERLPERFVPVLVACKDQHVGHGHMRFVPKSLITWDGHRWCIGMTDIAHDAEITHWMPLPDAPATTSVPLQTDSTRNQSSEKHASAGLPELKGK